ncbi:MAG: hypothetical protein ACOYZ7_00980 [Chloroflexota bacterium]
MGQAEDSWNVLDSPLASNLGTGISSYLLAESVEKGLAAYHRAAFHLEKTALWGKRLKRVPLSEAVDKAIYDVTVVGLIAERFVPRGLRARLSRLGRGLVDEAVWLNSGFVEVDEVVGYQFRRMYKLPGGRLAGRLAHSWGKHVLDWGIGVGIDVGVQWWLDKGNPYLTPTQKNWRMGIAAIGSAGSFVVALVVPGPGWVGFVVGIGASMIWDAWIAPEIHQQYGLEGQRKLRPLQ